MALINPENASNPLEEILQELGRDEQVQQMRGWAARQTDRRRVFAPLTNWAKSRNQPVTPATAVDWLSIAESCSWVCRAGVSWPIDEWVDAKAIAEASRQHDIAGMCELYSVMLASGYKRDLLAPTRDTLLHRLAAEEATIVVETEEEAQAHFLLTLADFERHGSSQSNLVHAQTLRRCAMLSALFPHKAFIGSQGYGHLVVDGQPDDSHKRIPREKLFPRWLPEFNSNFIGLGEMYFRPRDWDEYCRITHGLRARTAKAADGLARAIDHYFSHPKTNKLYGTQVSVDIFDEQRYEPPLLPLSAVDRWGFVHESQAERTVTPEAVSQACASAMKEYDRFRKPLQDYSNSFQNFIRQVLPLIVLQPLARASRVSNRDEIARAEKVEEYNGNLTNGNLRDAMWHLLEMQREIRPLMVRFKRETTALEERETSALSTLWALLQQMDFSPEQLMTLPRKSALGMVIDEATRIEDELLQVVRDNAGEGVVVRRLDECEWHQPCELPVAIDSMSALSLYQALDPVVAGLSDAFKHIMGFDGARDMRWRLAHLHLKGVSLVPLVDGQTLYGLSFSVNALTGTMLSTETPELLSGQLEPLSLPRLDTLRHMWLKTLEVGQLAAHLWDLNRFPLQEDSEGIVQAYVKDVSARASETLQEAIDAAALIRDWVNSDAARSEQRPNIGDMMDGLAEWGGLALPDEQLELGAEAFDVWRSSLEQAAGVAFCVLLLYVDDELALSGHTAGAHGHIVERR